MRRAPREQRVEVGGAIARRPARARRSASSASPNNTRNWCWRRASSSKRRAAPRRDRAPRRRLRRAAARRTPAPRARPACRAGREIRAGRRSIRSGGRRGRRTPRRERRGSRDCAPAARRLRIRSVITCGAPAARAGPSTHSTYAVTERLRGRGESLRTRQAAELHRIVERHQHRQFERQAVRALLEAAVAEAVRAGVVRVFQADGRGRRAPQLAAFPRRAGR